MGSRKPVRTTVRRPTRRAPGPRRKTTRAMPGSTCPPAPVAGSWAAAPCPKSSGKSSAADEGGLTMVHMSMSAKLGVGIGLRAPHVAQVLATRPAIGWLEVHAENYMGESTPLAALERLRADYPLSVHGVGLSLGSAEALDNRHLSRLQRLITRLEPVLVSEHLSWSIAGGIYLNHLLPLPYTEETLAIVV